MQKAFSFLTAYKLPIIIAFTLMLIELTVELASPLIIARIIDDGIRVQNFQEISLWGIILIILAGISFLAGIINSFFSSHVSQSFGYDLRQATFSKVQTFSFKNFNRFPTSSLITRLTNDVTQLQSIVHMSLRIGSRAPLLIVGSTTLAIIVDWKLSLILLLTMPILVLFVIWLTRKGIVLFRRVQHRLDNVNNVMRENLTAMRLIKAFLRSDHEEKNFAEASLSLRDLTIYTLRFMQISGPIIMVVMNLSILIILWFGHIQVANQANSVGEVVAIINYATRTMQSISMMTFILLAFSRAQASKDRINDILTEEIDLVDGDQAISHTAPNQHQLVFENVSFSYPNKKTIVLDQINLQIKQGETVAVIGATGSGKTTLFQLIPRLYDPTIGQVLFNGQPLQSLKLKALREKIGYVPQESRLFSGTIMENIRWGHPEATAHQIIEAAKAAQIHETIMKQPDQYQTIIGQRGVNFSGGQKQRLSIARALIRKPEILLLDDSTSALDLQTEAEILAAIKQLSCTTFIITQKISTLLGADHILLLENGKMAAYGDHHSLLETSSLYQQIYQSQYTEGVNANG
ncbi:ABC transporter ATP-binding protein [Amphibacillus sp. Q70]|uniref:ABC transporter ATP-binding protein n=1 Tax=Amphibacillus sp. Q70 TaxID=3453416 RepID=UPI003F82B464